MNSITRPVIITAALWTLLFVAGQASAEVNAESHAEAVLFSEFETVFHSEADMVPRCGAHVENTKLSGRSAFMQLTSHNIDVLCIPFGYAADGLNQLVKGGAAEILKDGHTIVAGAKDFRPPHGLGMVSPQFCYVIVFGERGVPKLSEYLAPTSTIASAGAVIWKWKSLPNSKKYPTDLEVTFFATEIGPRYLVISNNISELQTVAQKLISPDDPVRIVSEHLDWKIVSPHEYWGYRRYRHDGVEYENAAEVTPSARALSFFVDLEKKVGIVRLFADDGSTAAKWNATFSTDNQEYALPPFKRLSAKVWQTEIPLTSDERVTLSRLFLIVELLGFNIAL
jgi:hypothetical protein